MYHKKIASDRRSAFTLIEILVAAVITIIMIGLVVQITSEVLKIWNRSVGKLSATAEARIAMELLTSDLETAVLINNGQQWLRVEKEVSADDPVTVGLKLFAPALDRPTGQAGNICAINYRLARAPAYENAKVDTYVLFRALEDPPTTFDTLLGPASGDPQSALTSGFWAELNVDEPDPSNYLAGNIYSFKVYIYGIDDATGDQIILNVSSSDHPTGFAQDDSSFDGIIDLDYVYGGTGFSGQTPVFAEIFLTIISDEGINILSLPSLAGTGYTDVDDVVLKQGEVFKRRVYFQARPL